jgi:hypothetical protein
MRESPEITIVPPAAMGSCDCVVVRGANGNFAQDDSVMKETNEYR